jgi:hypothetical protein
MKKKRRSRLKEMSLRQAQLPEKAEVQKYYIICTEFFQAVVKRKSFQAKILMYKFAKTWI